MDKVKIKDKEYPIVIGRAALRMFALEHELGDVGMQEIRSMLLDVTMNQADYLNWCGFKAGCSAEGVEFPYSFEEFQEILTKHPHLVDEIDRISENQQPAPVEGNEKETAREKN